MAKKSPFFALKKTPNREKDEEIIEEWRLGFRISILKVSKNYLLFFF